MVTIATGGAANLVQGCQVAVGMNGAVYVAWEAGSSFSAVPVQIPSIMIRRSDNGGATFNAPVTVATAFTHAADPAIACGGSSFFGGWLGPAATPIRIQDFPSLAASPVNNDVYLVWNERIGADTDIVFYRSTNQGATWAFTDFPHEIVSKDQFQPAVTVNPKGVIKVQWYDRRNDPNNTNIELFAAISTDRGTTFDDGRVSDVAFGLDAFVLFAPPSCYMGEYNGITADDTHFYHVWGDNRDTAHGHLDPNVYFDRQSHVHFAVTLTRKYCNALPSAAPFSTNGIGGVPACTNPIPAAGAPTTITLNFDIPTGDLNFSVLASFMPPDSTVTPGGSIPVGDIVGGLESAATLGIGNGACATGVPVPFLLHNVALPDDTANPRASTNIYVPLPEGTSSDDEIGAGSPTLVDPEGVLSSGTKIDRGRFQNGVPATTPLEMIDGIADVAPGTSLAIQEYPDWLLDLFDPDWVPVDPSLDGPWDGIGAGTTPATTHQNANDGDLPPVLPLAAYGAMTAPQPASDDWIPLYFLVFDKGALPAGGFTAPNPLASLGAGLGYAMITILTDTSEVAADISLITDFCTSLTTNTMLLGETIPSNTVRATNPASGTGRAGTHLGLTYTTSLRDLDNDGWENAYDTCPKVANTDDPGLTPGVDLDMLDPACDPNPTFNEAGGPVKCPGQFLAQTQPGDIDGDCFSNAQDNCPQTANGRVQENVLWDNQRDGEAFGTYAAAAPDGGPKTDAIGDACDSGTSNFTQNGLATSVNLSPTVADGHYHSVGVVNPVCIGGTDNDGDGWCAATTGEDDSDANITPPLDLSPPDTDGDGFSVWIETFIGTDDTHGPSGSSTANDEPLDNWPPDFDDNQAVNLDDLSPYVPPLLSSVRGDGNYDARRDLNADTSIDMADMGIVNSMYGSSNGSARPAPLGGGDDDGDAVGDGSDSCPGTRSAQAVDGIGCSDFQSDWDLDGACNPSAPGVGPSVCTPTDNCPIISNPGQEDNDIGDGFDGGDACDPDDDNDGTLDVNDAFPFDPTEDTDTDSDGLGDNADLCPTVPTPWIVVTGDTDCDGWSDTLEGLIGTSPSVYCATDSWPPDFDNNQIVDIFDVSAMAPPKFFAFSPSGPPWVDDPNPTLYTVRHDMNADGIIDIFDVSALAPPLFFHDCTAP